MNYMKKFGFIVLFILSVSLASPPAGSEEPDIRTGDIIFQESWSGPGMAVKYLGVRKYTHAGIVIVYYNNIYVLEAMARVKVSKLQTFVKRGLGRHFTVKRLKDYDRLINTKSLKNLERIARRFIGKRYDYFFQWSDKYIYSSELIWKVCSQGLGVRLTGFRRLGSFDLTHPFTAEKFTDEFGDEIPLDEPVVTPDMLFNSHKLFTVYEN